MKFDHLVDLLVANGANLPLASMSSFHWNIVFNQVFLLVHDGSLSMTRGVSHGHFHLTIHRVNDVFENLQGGAAFVQ